MIGSIFIEVKIKNMTLSGMTFILDGLTIERWVLWWSPIHPIYEKRTGSRLHGWKVDEKVCIVANMNELLFQYAQSSFFMKLRRKPHYVFPNQKGLGKFVWILVVLWCLSYCIFNCRRGAMIFLIFTVVLGIFFPFSSNFLLPSII